VTDGELHDLDEVKEYSVRLARAVAAHKRNPLKFVLIGMGPDVNESQMEELDDLDAGVPVDLWDHKLAAEMRMLEEIFAEVVDKNSRVADNGKICDPKGAVLKSYESGGLPAYLEFEAPVGAAYFTLEVNSSVIHQPLYDAAVVPTSNVAAPAAAEPTPTKAAPQAAPKAAETVEDDDPNAEWRGIDLELAPDNKEPPPDVDLSEADKEKD
jgi:hypothetical protein